MYFLSTGMGGKRITMMTNRKQVLNEALHATLQRETDHGTPEDSFKNIANLWSAYLMVGLNASDVANMMILMKVARNMTNPSHFDNYVDIAGYAACGWDIFARNAVPTCDPETNAF